MKLSQNAFTLLHDGLDALEKETKKVRFSKISDVRERNKKIRYSIARIELVRQELEAIGTY